MAKNHFIHSLRLRTMVVATTLLALLSACNSSDEPEEINYIAAQSVAVTKFSLKPKATVMADLDSVFFSIDLKNRVIFNADSLPLGTNVTALVPLITYPSTVGKAEIEMTGGEVRTGTVDYSANPSDTIDFTGKVLLHLTSSDGSLSQTYTLKVNVHKCVADSLMWDKVAVSTLPSRFGKPTEQKTVDCNDKVVTLVKESNGSYTTAVCSSPADADWQTSTFAGGFTPQIRTLTAVGNTLYVLSDTGRLMKSTDFGDTWQSTNTGWVNIIGQYDGILMGINGTTNAPSFDLFPRPSGFTPLSLPSDFPTADFSNFTCISSQWSNAPIGFFTGGERNGVKLNHTWAYDGETWAKISNTPLPHLKDAVIVPYFCYRKTNASWIQTEYSVHLCMGGQLSDGSINPDLYISFDNGVNWKKGDELMQYPSFIQPGYAVDAIVRTSRMSADMDAHWKKASQQHRVPQKRIQYFVDGNDVEWDCPYIYLFGGHDAKGVLNDNVRRAVLARLTFAPIF